MDLTEKYAPKHWTEVIGQSDALTLIYNTLKRGQNYIFYGPSGTGKDSVVDVIRVDSPVFATEVLDWDGIFNYIDDRETTLVIKTTDYNRVPINIRSRCIPVFFKPVSDYLMLRHLTSICKKESWEYEQSALIEICHKANGDVRQALILLESVGGKGIISLDFVLQMYPDKLQDFGRTFFKHVYEADVEAGTELIKNGIRVSRDVLPLIDCLIEYLSECALNVVQQKSSPFSSKFIIKVMRMLWDTRIKVEFGGWNNVMVLNALFYAFMDENKSFKIKKLEYNVIKTMTKEASNFNLDDLIKSFGE